MKKIGLIVTTFLIATLFLASPLLVDTTRAQDDELKDPGVTPDGYLYGIDRAMESIQKSVVENKTKRAQMAMNFAEERLSEGLEMSYRGRNQLAQRMSEDYQETLNESFDEAEEVPGQMMKQRIQEKIANTTTYHQEVLNQIKNKVPGPARTAIQNALNHSMMGRERALGQLSENAPQRVAEMRYNHAKEIAKELRKEAQNIKIKARVEDGSTQVELGINNSEQQFMLQTTDLNQVIEEISQRTNLTFDEVKSYVQFERDGVEREIEIEVTVGAQQTEAIVKINESQNTYILTQTDRDAIVMELVNRTGLMPGQIYRNIELEDEREIDIEIEVEGNQTNVEAEVNGEVYNFTLQTTNQRTVIIEIANRTGLTTATVKQSVDDVFEIQDEAYRYCEELNQSMELMERAREMNMNVTRLQQKIANQTTQNLNALRHAYQKVPEQAKDPILNAMNNSLRCQNHSLEQVRQRNPNMAEGIEKGMPDWVKDMSQEWMNKSFGPGKGNDEPGMPNQDEDMGSGNQDEDMGPGMPNQDEDMGPGNQDTKKPEKPIEKET
ncbi:hypothetical protein C9439_08070 [archaeon SCG-AAA382B04]|nr:hypothetical protein C9439_08070 [archaeon SCG-AAA382B04]